MSYKDEASRSHEKKLRSVVGRAHGGSVTEKEVNKIAKKDAKAAVRKHREHDWHLSPEEVKKDVDKDEKKHFAHGGRAKSKGDVNIIIDAGGGKGPMEAAPPGAMPARPMPPPAPPPRPAAPPMPPPGAGAPSGGMPPGAAPRPAGPMPPPGAAPVMPPRATGGRVPMTAGAGSGEGRLQKISRGKLRD